MRSLGLIGLVLALLVVGVLVKKRMSGNVPVVPMAPPGATAPSARAQGTQIEQQVRQQLDAAAQARPIPDEAR